MVSAQPRIPFSKCKIVVREHVSTDPQFLFYKKQRRRQQVTAFTENVEVVYCKKLKHLAHPPLYHLFSDARVGRDPPVLARQRDSTSLRREGAFEASVCRTR